MTLTITTGFAAGFAVLMLALWTMVTRQRAVTGVSIGAGGNQGLHEAIRRHGNFMEWVPMTLVLMALAEMQGAGAVWLWSAGALALTGRLVHPFGLRAGNAAHPLRIVGNVANIFALLILIGLLTRAALG